MAKTYDGTDEWFTFYGFAMLPLIWYNWLDRLLLGTLSVDPLLLLNMESEMEKLRTSKRRKYQLCR